MFKESITLPLIYFAVSTVWQLISSSEIKWIDNIGVSSLIFLFLLLFNWSKRPYKHKKEHNRLDKHQIMLNRIMSAITFLRFVHRFNDEADVRKRQRRIILYLQAIRCGKVRGKGGNMVEENYGVCCVINYAKWYFY